MQRYFATINFFPQVGLSNDDIHHLLHVMRMKKGDEIEVVADNKAYLCRLENISPLSVVVVHEIDNDVELKEEITLLFALTKGDKIDLVIQKATELGVSKIALIESERSVVTYQGKDTEKKIVRFEKIIKEASEQSHRLKIPQILGIFDLKNLPLQVMSDLNYVAYECDASQVETMFSGITKGKSISLLIGPEGGFSELEIKMLTEKGFIRTSLGKRILRAETAAIYGLSVLGYILEI